MLRKLRSPSSVTRNRVVQMLGGALLLAGLCSEWAQSRASRAGEVRNGDAAVHGGTAAVRRAFEPITDDPRTTDDESNDQPIGHFGSVTIEVTSAESGHTYTLDAEVDGTSLERIYFPRGGWVDFVGCEIDEDLCGECDDEEGRWWTFEGEGAGVTHDWYEDDSGMDEAGADEQVDSAVEDEQVSQEEDLIDLGVEDADE